MAADLNTINTASGVAVQASGGGMWAMIIAGVTTVLAIILKNSTDSHGEAMRAQAEAFSGERNNLLLMIQQFQGELTSLRKDLGAAQVELATLKQKFEDATASNTEMQNVLRLRNLRVKQLADGWTLDRQKLRATELALVSVQGEANALLVELGRPAKYPPIVPPIATNPPAPPPAA